MTAPSKERRPSTAARADDDGARRPAAVPRIRRYLALIGIAKWLFTEILPPKYRYL